MDNQITKYILSLMKIKGIGPAFIKKRIDILKKHQHNIDEFKRSFYDSLSEKEKEKIDIEKYIEDAAEILQQCLENNIILIDISNDLYPKNLLELKDPPSVLYCKGNISLLEKRIIGIIGTRKATELGKKIANKAGSFFSKDFSIVNGLVDGIDKYAILNNDRVYSNVIGVISGGLNFYTTSSKITQDLAKKTLENNGLLISESAPNQKEDAFSGSKSSRIQSGLADAIILIQSSIDGGSKYTLNSFKVLERVLGIINFNNNEEFNNNEAFSANRLIVKEGLMGLTFMCEKIDQKKVSFNNEIDTKKTKTKIKIINDKKDYDDLINTTFVKSNVNNNLLDFLEE